MISFIKIISILLIRYSDIACSMPWWPRLNKDFTRAFPRLSGLYSCSLFPGALDAIIKEKALVRELNNSLGVKPELSMKFSL